MKFITEISGRVGLGLCAVGIILALAKIIVPSLHQAVSGGPILIAGVVILFLTIIADGQDHPRF